MSFATERDFFITKFDGGCRDAFQFIKFFYSMLEREGISSIVNLTLSPNIKAPDDIMMIEKPTSRYWSQPKSSSITTPSPTRQPSSLGTPPSTRSVVIRP